MATHSSTLALKIPWTEELGAGYYPWGRKESGMTERLHFHFQLIFLLRGGLHLFICETKEVCRRCEICILSLFQTPQPDKICHP